MLSWDLAGRAANVDFRGYVMDVTEFGKVMSAVKPRIAVAYHFFKDFDTMSGVYERIRSTYDDPLSLAEHYMVWNVTKAGFWDVDDVLRPIYKGASEAVGREFPYSGDAEKGK